MGAVYEAVDLRLRNTVAVKQMTSGAVQANLAFEREARLLAALRHPALPVVIDYFADATGQFLVMQYIEGEDLAHALRRRGTPFDTDELVGCALAVAGALAYLHRHDPPILHRDLKPHNINRTPTGDYVLLDFGLATGLASDSTVAIDERSILGYTPQYAPPEQMDRLPTDPRSDIFALGATLFHLAMGMAPPTARERLRCVADGVVDPLAQRLLLKSDLDRRVHMVIARALALDPRDRFQSASEIITALSAADAPMPHVSASEVSSDQRRIDAAIPTQAEVGRAIDLIVQVRFQTSPRLGLEDWPARRKPERIEQASECLELAYPIDPVSGQRMPARLRFHLVAPDFAVAGASEQLVDVPPHDYSKRLAFLLTPQRVGFCRVNVEVYGMDTAFLGVIAIEAEALGQAVLLTPGLRVANLELRLVVEQVAFAPRKVGSNELIERKEPPHDARFDGDMASTRIPVRPTAGSVGGTLVGSMSADSSDATSTFASAPTIIVTPPKAKLPAPKGGVSLPWNAGKEETSAKGPAKEAKAYAREVPPSKSYAPATPRSGTAGRREDRLWVRYRSAALDGGVALAVVSVAAVVWFIRFAPAGQLLTITKSEGGTLSAAGIRCGTRGSDCSTARPNGDAIELTPQADAGYTFVEYTGDCAPGGRTIMTSTRTCGAIFTRDAAPATPAGATQLLTVLPQTGGTVEGVDIVCGTKGSACAANVPEGRIADLHPIADDGFTFMGFKGDCAPLGRAQMTGPRTCSAIFSPTSEVSSEPSKTPASRGRSSNSAPAVAQAPSAPSQPPAPASAAAPTPPVPVLPRAAARGPVVDPTQAAAKPVPAPPTDEEFAKGKIQELMKGYCAAFEALDPDAVQKFYPTVNMYALRAQLNKSKYRSVQCKFGEPLVYVSLDAPAGKAVLKVPLKQVYEQTILTEKPMMSELMATMTLFRSGPRTRWLIQDVKYAPTVR